MIRTLLKRLRRRGPRTIRLEYVVDAAGVVQQEWVIREKAY